MRVLLVPACEVVYLNQLGPRTLARCQEALRRWAGDFYEVLVVSGGIYELPHVQTVPAAKLMCDWFVSNGVHPGQIVVEDHSLDTFENVSLSLAKIRALQPEPLELEIVTQTQHARRFWLSFFLGYRIWPKLHRIEYQMSLKEKFMEWLFLLIHLFWPKDGGPLGEKNRMSRRRKH